MKRTFSNRMKSKTKTSTKKENALAQNSANQMSENAQISKANLICSTKFKIEGEEFESLTRNELSYTPKCLPKTP
jgi:hypothetical protein